MSLEIRPCRYGRAPNSAPGAITAAARQAVEECSEAQAEFFGLYRRSLEEPKLAFHLDDFPTRERATAAMDYELRCQAFEAEGMPRSDAQALVDLELLEPIRRKSAHGLPQALAEAGFRIEYGHENYVDGSEPNHLRGKWWWTFSGECDVATSEAEWSSAAEAVADAQRAFDDGYDIDDDEWDDAVRTFGLDPAFSYTPAQMRDYVRKMFAAEERAFAIEKSLRELRQHIVYGAQGSLTREQFDSMLARADAALSRGQ
jgi:hypothetical protein